MKKIVLILSISIIALLNIQTSNAQIDKVWLLNNSEIDGKTYDIFLKLEFKSDNQIIFGTWPVGTWKYNSKKKRFNIKSESLDKFNGEWNVKKLDANEFVISKGEVTHYFVLYNLEKFSTDNNEFDLIGTWKKEDDKGELNHIIFELPNLYKKGNSTTHDSDWFFNKTNNTVTIIPKGAGPGKKWTIEKINNENFKFICGDEVYNLIKITK